MKEEEKEIKEICVHPSFLYDLCVICGERNNLEEKKMKKLNLVLDLDQTLIHSLIESESVGDKKIMKEKNIYRFKLNNISFETECRPFLNIFFKSLKEKFYFFIYTNGLEDYCYKIIEILKLHFYKEYKENLEFKNVIFRRENESFYKKIEKLNLNKKETIILDDRLDIWNFSDNLIPIFPYRETDINYENIEKVPEIDGNIKIEETDLEKNRKILEETVEETEDRHLLRIKDLLLSLYEEYFNEDCFTKEDIKEIEEESTEEEIIKGIKETEKEMKREMESIEEIADRMFDEGTEEESEEVEEIYSNKKLKIAENSSSLDICSLLEKDISKLLKTKRAIFENLIIKSEIFLHEISFLGGKIYNANEHTYFDIEIKKDDKKIKNWLLKCLFNMEYYPPDA